VSRLCRYPVIDNVPILRRRPHALLNAVQVGLDDALGQVLQAKEKATGLVGANVVHVPVRPARHNSVRHG